jgi:Ricin-type beta-trefoil lectin domain-like
MRKPRRLIFALAGLMAAAGTVLGAAVPAAAVSSDAPLYWDGPIVNYGSGMCLEPIPGDDGILGVNGLPIQQSWCDSSVPQQQWHAELIGHTTFNGIPSGIFLIVNDQTGMCLDDRDGRTSDWSPVQQWTCTTASTTMQWMMGTGDGNGYNPLVNMRAVRNGGSACLDVAYGSGEAGAALQLYHCTAGNPAQKFLHPIMLYLPPL